MKFIERLSLTIFSLIILILSIALLLIMFNVVTVKLITVPISCMLSNITAYRVTLVVVIVLILLAIKCIFFRSKTQSLGKDGIVLENANGKLVISKESLENLVASAAKEIPGADVATSKTYLDRDKELKVFVTITAARDVMLKDISTELQDKIKQAMKNTADLEVKEVNVKVKNITSKKVNKKKKDSKDDENVSTDLVTEEEVEEDENSEKGDE